MHSVEKPRPIALRIVGLVMATAGSFIVFRWQWLACASAYMEEYEENQRLAGGWSHTFGFTFGFVPVIAVFVLVVAVFTWMLFGRVRSFRSSSSAVIVGVLRAVALALLAAALTCGAAFLFAEAELGGQIFDPASYREPYVP